VRGIVQPVGESPPEVERRGATRVTIRSAPQRFVETWIDAIAGFFFCVVLPIPIYATGEPFAGAFGGTEQTIVATAAAYVIAWYCGRRVNAFPSTTVHTSVGYTAPVVVITFASIAVLLLILRSDYSRVQLLGSGILTIIWMAFASWVRGRYLTRSYAVVPSKLVAALPPLPTCRWLTFEEVEQHQIRADAIVADLDAGLDKDQLAALTGGAIAGVPVLDRRYVLENLRGRTPFSGLTPNEFGALLPSRQYLLVRRTLELALTIAALPFLLVILIVVAAFVRTDSAGPIFFSQQRVGRQGRVFRMFKFRSMRPSAVGPSFTEVDDPRITRVGTVLRRYRLDELPQVLNVLRGDMSWVGPRPEAMDLNRNYVRDIPHFALRNIVRPGVTGWAQVNQGYAHDDDGMRAKLEYDLFYLKHCSLWLDVAIVLRTVTAVVFSRGAR
jgi:lipopolysaccharide/colanic/teichoic acid biosynthesis glycosyltransferase